MVGRFLFQEQHVLRHLGKMASYFFSRFGLEGFGVFVATMMGRLYDIISCSNFSNQIALTLYLTPMVF